ncbi:MAG: pseudouridine-5'-phosphate glycosidase, partial [Acidimicrobiales bacterium]
MSGPVSVLPEVAAALAGGRPVVALESTLIAHGLPAPRNLSVALDLEARLRDRGVTPATIGVVDGVPTVGLDRAGLEIMAGAGGGAGPDPGPSGEEPGRGGKEQGHVEEQGRGVAKASVRDLPVLLANGRSAATTVAATSYLAWRAGVRVFATGGLGGVHRGAASSYDESADLVALSRTPVAVVCAGVKSILDVAATLERLESLGVTVVGYGTNRFPGFY